MPLKTVLYTHAWLDCPIPGYRSEDGTYCRRLERFLEHYGDSWPVVVLDNGSKPESCLAAERPGVKIVNAQPHLTRPEFLVYPAVWRFYYYAKTLLEEYEKVIIASTDAYICSQRLVDYVESIQTGWTSLWCPKYNFREDSLSVIVRGCETFENFLPGEFHPDFRRGEVTEEVVQSYAERGFIGDRYDEGADYPRSWNCSMDYYAQVPDDPNWEGNFPILRRIDGQVLVLPTPGELVK